MPRAGVRKGGGPKRMVWDGQSRCNWPPAPNGGGMVPHLLMTGRGIPWSVPAVDGFGWNLLTADDQTRLWPLADLNDATGLWLTGGEADLNAGASSATIISRITSYANLARTAGFAPIAATTIPGAGVVHFDAAAEIERAAYNTALLAMAGGAVFEYVVDMEEGGSGPLVYFDGSPYYEPVSEIHYSDEGAIEGARICLPTHELMLGDLDP